MDYTSYEINNMTIDRLLIMQKKLLQHLRLMINDSMSDENDIFFKLEEIEVMNLVIIKKLEKGNKNGKK